MKVYNWNESSQVVIVLAGLAIAGLEGLRLSKELRGLVASPMWRHASPSQKHQLLHTQYDRDYFAADHQQREVMAATRRKIEAKIQRYRRHC